MTCCGRSRRAGTSSWMSRSTWNRSATRKRVSSTNIAGKNPTSSDAARARCMRYGRAGVHARAAVSHHGEMMATIRFSATPNHNAAKFTADRTIVEGKSSRSFYNVEQAATDPIAAALFELAGVASVFMVADFVTVTKQPDAEWSELVPAVSDVLERVLP